MDLEKLVDFFNKAFPGRWKNEIISYVNNNGDLKNVILLWEDAGLGPIGNLR